MFKNSLLILFLFLGSFATIYPSKKENTNLIDYCYALEKILSRNLLKKGKNVIPKYKTFAKDISLFGINKSRGVSVNKIINKYKTSQKSSIINLFPNKVYCLAGYWIEELKPGTFQSILFEKTNQKINQYKKTKKEVDEFIKDIDSEYKSIQKEINDYF